ncbi:ABC transporter permease [Aquimonas sp.]|jgi:putative ABC transport system permease protein|uniref:ABC transporter permease n=1 Tax=Aquimonas sp. TaxID=1872588 RepID=UPI0037BE2354
MPPQKLFASLALSLRGALWQSARSLRVQRRDWALWVLLIGIGCAVASLGVQLLRTVLLAPLPYPQAEQLVRIRESSPPSFQGFQVSLARFAYWQQQAKSFSAMAQYRTTGVSLGSGDGAERVAAARVTPDLLQVLGSQLSWGSGFADEDTPQVLISDRVWRTQLQSDTRRLLQPLWVEGERHQIAGVLPAGFDFPEAGAELLLRWQPDARELAGVGGNRAHVIARLKPSTDAAAALAEITALAQQFELQYPKMRPWQPEIGMHAEDLVAPQRPALLMLTVVIVLLILSLLGALAALALLRAAAQGSDSALKSALGATAAQLRLQGLFEVLLPGLLGGALGLVLATLGAPLLATLAGPYLPRAQGFSLHVENAVLGLLMGPVMAVLAALPSIGWAAASAPSATALRAHRSVPMVRLRTALIGAKFSLAFVLLASSLALIAASARTAAIDPGFATTDRQFARFSLPTLRYADDDSVYALQRRVLEEARAIPGVESASLSHSLPVLRHYQLLVDVEDGLQSNLEAAPSGNYALVSEQHLKTLGLRLLRGRAIDASDHANAAPVALVSAGFEQRWFGDGEALGKRVRVVNDPAWREVVGVVADIDQHGAGLDTVPQLYGPLAQRAERDVFLVLQSGRSAADLQSALRARLQTLDPALALDPLRPLAEVEPLSIKLTRMLAAMVAGFALAAVLIALLGLYASLRVAVLQRQREFGLRRALGASDRVLLGVILRPALGLAVGGCLLGVCLQVLLQHLGAGWLQGLPMPAPLQLVTVALTLLSLSLLAALGPASTALRAPSMQMLRAH